MQTVFSHIVQKRLSQVNEDVATDALTFVLHSRESARRGMMKLIRGIIPDMPPLLFRTQQTEDSVRPDMWGYDEREPRVFVENKFWAGLTGNQPVAYLQLLAKYTQPALLLVIGPDAREQTLWRELSRRLVDAGIASTNLGASAGIAYCVTTALGPVLALTSWTKLLHALELEVTDDQLAASDLGQLRALCETADSDAFFPISPAEVTDQRTPAFILQMGSILQASVDLAVAEGVLHIGELRPQASWERTGRYARFSDGQGIGVWFGIHFPLWKAHAESPFWLLFSQSEFGRANEVRPLLEPWAAREGVFTTVENHELAVAVDIALDEEKDQVVRSCVRRLAEIGKVLQSLRPRQVSGEHG